jgi:UDP:flavonoid glycosyltransferase YjiC (YdhE family)
MSHRLDKKLPSSEKPSQVKYPPQVLPIDSIPHPYIFPLVDVVVHHGGSGTTAAGLRAGKPTIIKPFFGDQRFWGEQVEKMKVGHVINNLKPSTLATTIVSVLGDQSIQDNALVIGSKLANENGADNAIEQILLELSLMRY